MAEPGQSRPGKTKNVRAKPILSEQNQLCPTQYPLTFTHCAWYMLFISVQEATYLIQTPSKNKQVDYNI